MSERELEREYTVYTYLLTFGMEKPKPIAYLRPGTNSPDLKIFKITAKSGREAKRKAEKLRRELEESDE